MDNVIEIPNDVRLEILEIENKFKELGGKLLFKCVSGSRAYNVNKPTSDYDIRGVFILPTDKILTNQLIEQVSNEKNDIVFYELGKFMNLLKDANPNILELLNIDDKFILFKSSDFQYILDNKDYFLTKRVRDTFLGYAKSQIKKAKGMKKKINDPVEPKKKDLLDFCYIIPTNRKYFTEAEKVDNKVPKSRSIKKFFNLNHINQAFCGLEVVNNMRDLYFIYYDDNGDILNKAKLARNELDPVKYKEYLDKSKTPYNIGFHGLIKNETTSQLRVSSIPKYMKYIGLLSCNFDGYKQYLKKYREYWEWVNKRNEERYKENTKGGKEYDLKNMMHTVRLIDMAIDIVEGNGVVVYRDNNYFLMNIRDGKYTYEELMEFIEKKIETLDENFEKCDLPEEYNKEIYNEILLKLRKKYV